MKLFLIISLSALAFGHIHGMETERSEILDADFLACPGKINLFNIEFLMTKYRERLIITDQELTKAEENGNRIEIALCREQHQRTLNTLNFLVNKRLELDHQK